ncbi:uncharacterized protein LOC132722763 isoform X2 [Ruditapes philippinarum]|nr:uncharacterized protein LOC132722763 isoform X2 [Ruditapes philippinarum]XP_060563478.1 uncharacterized protein LOC132722763 isoform X2 [Ruditapes philippinarum]
MQFAIVLMALVGVSYGSNVECWTVQQIADKVFELADADNNGIVTTNEFKNELLTDWGFANGCLSRSDFTHNWQLHFHDTAQNAHAFFDNLDMNVDHSLCETEVVVVLLPFDNVVHDFQIQHQEMVNFILAKHPDPHHKLHGCH